MAIVEMDANWSPIKLSDFTPVPHTTEAKGAFRYVTVDSANWIWRLQLSTKPIQSHSRSFHRNTQGE